MTQTQAVEEIIRKQGGVSTLKDIYKHIHEIEGCDWKTKTPDATIRRIVQQDSNIIRLRPGYYMLAEFKDQLTKHSTHVTQNIIVKVESGATYNDIHHNILPHIK